MTGRLKKYWPGVLALALLPALLITLNLNKLGLPTAQWDGWALDSAADILAGDFASRPYLIHPPLYLYLLAGLRAVFGGDALAAARLFGFASYLTTGWLVFLLGRRLAPAAQGGAAGLAAAVFYYASPLALQGALLLDLGDTSLVPLVSSVYFLALGCRAGTLPGGLALAALFALNLWAKFIHTLFMGGAAACAWLFGGREAWGGRQIRLLAAGVLLFAATWAVYAFACLNPADRLAPLDYLFGGMFYGYQKYQVDIGVSAALREKAIEVFRIGLWLWPPLLLWGLRVSRRGFGRGCELYFNWYLLLFMVAGVVSKSTSNGFPKYHAAVLPLLCALGAAWVVEKLAAADWRALLPRALAGAGAGAALVFLAGDPFLTFNHGFKAAAILGEPLPAARLLVQLACAPAAALLAWLAAGSLGRRERVLLALACAALAWQTGVGGLQARAGYFTHYGYGTEGKAETAAWLAARAGRGAVFAPNEFEPELRAAGLPVARVNDRCLMDRGCVLEALRAPATAFFVFGQASHTFGQVRTFLAFTPADIGREFTVTRRGDFWIYALGGAVPKPRR